jgi:spore coat polysaccharide biosynthesis protein SpsF (cytidylyltransferase family)
VYKANLSKWYVERKAVHDLDALNENQTAADRKIVLERRGKVAALARLAKAKEREERMAKFEEETTDMWLRAWEEKITRLGKERRAKCEAVLLLPETPDDLKLQKDLNKRIKAQIKDVLRR